MLEAVRSLLLAVCFRSKIDQIRGMGESSPNTPPLVRSAIDGGAQAKARFDIAESGFRGSIDRRCRFDRSSNAHLELAHSLETAVPVEAGVLERLIGDREDPILQFEAGRNPIGIARRDALQMEDTTC
jgi:hypothetical protein